MNFPAVRCFGVKCSGANATPPTRDSPALSHRQGPISVVPGSSGSSLRGLPPATSLPTVYTCHWGGRKEAGGWGNRLSQRSGRRRGNGRSATYRSRLSAPAPRRGRHGSARPDAAIPPHRRAPSRAVAGRAGSGRVGPECSQPGAMRSRRRSILLLASRPTPTVGDTPGWRGEPAPRRPERPYAGRRRSGPVKPLSGLCQLLS
jgi:hypothetical protein